MMDLHNYPLDEQNCTVEIESCKFVALETVAIHETLHYLWLCFISMKQWLLSTISLLHVVLVSFRNICVIM